MANRPMRNCRVCGAEFESSPQDSTVNCPKHRGRQIKVTKTPAELTDKERQEYYNMGKSDAEKHLKKGGSREGFGGYRNAAFGKMGTAQLINYESGYKSVMKT